MSETATMEKHSFQTEVKQLLHLMVHSLYSNKEIFLRELISNAADAVDKLRFKSLNDAGLLGDDPEFRIRILVDKDKGTLTISDNGIGMNKEDLISHLGTIAKSGTAEFLGKLTGEQKKDAQLIGQFGVGFYSGFIVADEITVVSKAAGSDQAYLWHSKGDGEFDIGESSLEHRGTEVILHLKDAEKEFLDDWRLRSVISKYSDHIAVPVQMLKPQTPKEDDKEEVIDVPEFEAVNKATAMWTRAKSEVNDDEYKEFYRHISHDFGEPLAWAHNRVEGKQEYTSLLYVPKTAPFDLWNRDRVRGVKLYVQRVFIMDDAEQFLPVYLRFVRGVLDSNDLPLNVSREILQDSSVTQSLKNACVKRVLSLLDSVAQNQPDDYQNFWGQFGSVLKEGLGEDYSNREAIAGLLRFASTHTNENVQNVSLDNYIERMNENQEKIYYITAESFATAKNSPHLEVFRKKGIEVLLMSDRIDEWAISHLTEYKEKKLVSVTQGALDLGDLENDDEKQAREKIEKDSQPLVERIQKVLGHEVKEVKVTTRLTDSPACVVSSEGEMSSQMARLMAAAGQAAPDIKPVFEINPEHALVQKAALQEGDSFDEWVRFLFEQALLSESGSLNDPGAFASRVNKLLLNA